jgi:hypothetical protein
VPVFAALAPLGMLGGWTVAGARQSPAMTPCARRLVRSWPTWRRPPWIMTAGSALTGVGYLATAAAARLAWPSEPAAHQDGAPRR